MSFGIFGFSVQEIVVVVIHIRQVTNNLKLLPFIIKLNLPRLISVPINKTDKQEQMKQINLLVRKARFKRLIQHLCFLQYPVYNFARIYSIPTRNRIRYYPFTPPIGGDLGGLMLRGLSHRCHCSRRLRCSRRWRSCRR